MSEPTPSGPIAEALQAADDLIAGLEAWQAMCGVAEGDRGTAEGKAAAAAHIHWPEVEVAGLSEAARRALRPICCLALAGGGGAERQAHPNTWRDRLAIWAKFWVLADSEQTTRTGQYIAFANAMGSVEAELRAASGIAALNVARLERMTAPQRPHPADVAKGVLDELTIEYELTVEG